MRQLPVPRQVIQELMHTFRRYIMQQTTQSITIFHLLLIVVGVVIRPLVSEFSPVNM